MTSVPASWHSEEYRRRVILALGHIRCIHSNIMLMEMVQAIENGAVSTTYQRALPGQAPSFWGGCALAEEHGGVQHAGGFHAPLDFYQHTCRVEQPP